MSPEEQIRNYIAKELAPDSKVEISADTSLIDEVSLDSTALMQMVLWIEDNFGVSVETEDMTAENFATVRNIAAYVQRNQSGKDG